MLKKTNKRVALFIRRHPDIYKLAQVGIYRYTRPRHTWVFLSEREVTPENILKMKPERLSGAIGTVGTPALAAAARELNIPFVNLYGGHPFEGLSQVGIDDMEIGRMAAQNLLGKGFENFAFYGLEGRGFSWGVWLGFKEELNKNGKMPTRFLNKAEYPALREEFPLENIPNQQTYRWLATLPKPVAILGCDDARAQWVTEACWRMGLKVPGEVAVLGVNNDRLHCYESYPPLSSIELPAELAGYEAAHKLSLLMSGKKQAFDPVFLRPKSVVERQSTDTLAIDDAQVATALHFIRENACKRITVEDIVKQTALSRRILENRFRRHLGCTPFHEMRRVQIERVNALLRETNLTIEQIADETGFGSGIRLSLEYKKNTNEAPGAYRARFRHE